MSEEILVVRERLSAETLRALLANGFGDMVKLVADIERGCLAVGGQLHADAELRLIEDGSRQEDLWGANYYPGRGVEGCMEYTSFINIRPAQGNPGMELEDSALRLRLRELVFALVGRGEALDGPA